MISRSLDLFFARHSYWAIEPGALRLALSDPVRAQAQYGRSPDGPLGLLAGDGPAVGILPLVGPLSKYTPGLASLLGDWAGTSLSVARAELERFAEDDQVQGIVLLICSPGGDTLGVDDFALQVRDINQRKPVVAYIEDYGASAAYWIAANAGRVIANPAALVGSIGVYLVLEDTSAAAQRAGVQVYLVHDGEFKGGDAKGVPIDEDQIAETRRVVGELTKLFIRSVAAGRNLEPDYVRSLADGRVHIAEEAARLGLVDEVAGFDRALDWAGSGKTTAGAEGSRAQGVKGAVAASSSSLGPANPRILNPSPTGGPTMSEPQSTATLPAAQASAQETPTDEKKKDAGTSRAATIEELEEKLPDAASDFVLSCLRGGLTADQAGAMYNPDQHSKAACKPKSQTTEEEEKKKEGAPQAAAAQTQRARALNERGRGEYLEDGADQTQATDGSAAGLVESEVLKELQLAKAAGLDLTKAQAHRKVMRKEPELRKQLVAEHNAAFGRKV